MARIYTRSGDDGTTGVRGGRRVRKDAPRVAACGTLDELNSAIGLARSLRVPRQLDKALAEIQRDLFAVRPERVGELERLIDRLEAEVPVLRTFILPGGSPAGAALHLARTICRRAERCFVRLPERATTVPYLNRLGDLLFVMARWVNHRQGAREVSHQRGSRRTGR
jgi:cob(I)alamin adenosyltransferase